MFNRWKSPSQPEPPASSIRNTKVVERRHERYDVAVGASFDCPTHGMRGVQQKGCVVRNISRGGAAIHVGPGFDLVPDMFILDIPMSAASKMTVNCQVVGRSAGMLHLKFLKEIEAWEINALLNSYASQAVR